LFRKKTNNNIDITIAKTNTIKKEIIVLQKLWLSSGDQECHVHLYNQLNCKKPEIQPKTIKIKVFFNLLLFHLHTPKT
jgi:hypothetical protein